MNIYEGVGFKLDEDKNYSQIYKQYYSSREYNRNQVENYSPINLNLL